MTQRIVSLAAILLTLTLGTAVSAELHGDWSAELSRSHPETLYLSIEFGAHDQHGSDFELSEFRGLSRADLESKTSVPVRFELSREAGTLSFDGTFRNGKGIGELTFEPNDDYAARLRALGVTLVSKHGDADRDLLELALFDVSTDFIRSMQKLGYDESLEKYIAFRIFRVDPAYVREMKAVGFGDLSADKLIETRIHGATPEYIREARAAGQDLSLDEYIQARIFRITPEYADQLARAGYPNLDRDMLLQFRIQNVTPEFIRELGEVGYSKVPAEQLVQLRIFGVTPAYIRRMNRGGGHVAVDDLIQRKIGF